MHNIKHQTRELFCLDVLARLEFTMRRGKGGKFQTAKYVDNNQ